MKVLFVNPPITAAPMFSKGFDRFLMPLSYLCLSGAILEAKVATPVVVDCQALRLGWGALRERMRREDPDVVCVGPKMTFQADAARIFAMARELKPGVVTVGGGYFYSEVTEASLRGHPLDYVVRWEGERALVELLAELQKPAPRVEDVRGLCYLRDGAFHQTPFQPLIENLDDLPRPPYGDLPNHADYGAPDRWPGSIAVQHSRGCPATCSYCQSWDLEGQHEVKDGVVSRRPRYRSKSPEVMVDELDHYRRRFGHDYFIFVDSTWNASAKFNRGFSELVLEREMGISWYAFLRGDYVLRDEESGVFELMVKAGLKYLFVGIEREHDGDLEALDRTFHAPDQTRRVCKLLSQKYPELVTTGAIVIGSKQETRESMLSLFDFAVDLDIDFISAYALTPNPGTALWQEARDDGRLETEAYDEYNWIYPIMRSDALSREEIYELGRVYYRKWFTRRPAWLLRGLVGRGPFKRGVYLHMIVTAVKIFAQAATSSRGDPWWMRRPRWLER